MWRSCPECCVSLIICLLSESEIWSALIVRGPSCLFLPFPGLFSGEVYSSRFRMSVGLPLPNIPDFWVPRNSGLVSIGLSCNGDRSGVAGVLSSLRANLPSGPLGPVPLLEGSCPKGVIGLLISLQWIILLSAVVTVWFVPIAAVCIWSEYGRSKLVFVFFRSKKFYFPSLSIFSFIFSADGRSYRLLHWMCKPLRFLVLMKRNNYLLVFWFRFIVTCCSIPCSVLYRISIQMPISLI